MGLVLSLSVAIIILLTSPIALAAHHKGLHHALCIYAVYTTLHVYTQPVQKICTILDNGKVVQAQDQPPIILNSSNSTDGGKCVGNTCHVQAQNKR